MRVGWFPQKVSEGVDRGVVYLTDGTAVPWDGLVAVDELSDMELKSDLYFDGGRYALTHGLETFGAKVTSITYPDQLDDPFAYFGFSYRTKDGDTYKIHLVYNATAIPSDKARTTKDDSVDISNFEWNIVTRAEEVADLWPTAHIIIDQSIAYEWVMKDLEDILYGTDTTDPAMPTIESVMAIFEEGAIVKITNHGDGTWTATGPDSVVVMTSPTSFEIVWPSVIEHGDGSFTISSL